MKSISASKTWGVSPHNAGAECSVLGSVLVKPACLDLVAVILKPDDFFDADRRTIFEAMLSLRSHGKPADTVTLAEELERLSKFDEVGGAAALAELLETVPNAEHVEHYGQLVREDAIRRRLIQQVVSVAERANSKAGLDELRPMLVTLSESVIDIDETVNRASGGKDPSTGAGGFVRFPVEALPWPLDRFVSEGAESLRCDPCFIALPLLSMLAGAVGNSRRIRIKRDWSEPCLIWSVIVAHSGTMKSPAWELALRPMREAQHAAFVAYKAAREVFDRDRMEFDAALADWRKQGRKRGEAAPVQPVEPVPTRHIVEDITIERLAEMLEEQPRGLLLAVDELAAWFGGFNRYANGKGSDAERWLSIHRAGPITSDRKSTAKKLIYVPRAAVSVTGGIQLATLGRVLRSREFIDNGTAARLLVAMPPRRPKQWTDAELSEEMQASLDHIVRQLLSLEFGLDEHGSPVPITLPFTTEARTAFVRFFNQHNREQALLGDDLAATWSKLEAYVPRLALLFHLVRVAANDPNIETPDAVDSQSLESAITLIRWFANEARRVYGLLGSGDDSEESRRRWLAIEAAQQHGGRITVRELMRSRAGFTLADDAEQTLNALVAAGLMWREQSSPGKAGGRPTVRFVLTALTSDPANDSDTIPSPVDTTSTKSVSGEVSSMSMSLPDTVSGNDVARTTERRRE